MYRSITLRLKPTKQQERALENILAVSCDLYNAALQERRDAWNIRRKSINLYDQYKELAEIRANDLDIKTIASDIAREPLRRVDRAFKAFFRRCKSGEQPGYPRFRPKARYNSFAFGSDPVRILANVLIIPNLGGLRFRTSQKIQGDYRTATIKRSGKKWTARILCDLGPAPDRKSVSTATGIDLGLTNFVTLSNGIIVDNPRWTRQHAERIAKAGQVLSRKQHGSKNRLRARATLSRAHQRAADARRNFIHHISKWLVQNHDLIAHEKLNIKGMVQYGHLGKSILDAAWGELIYQVRYKAEEAGVHAIGVNPRKTTMNCSGCGKKVPKTLSQRTHDCPFCGLVLDRDHNAAINILRLGLSLAGISIPSERRFKSLRSPKFVSHFALKER